MNMNFINILEKKMVQDNAARILLKNGNIRKRKVLDVDWLNGFVMITGTEQDTVDTVYFKDIQKII